ncbi:MAG: hypothetical protein HYZ75_00165 [Elusimicrobia bacterium]|nr:hypothetical protein [Elusimicrobiota bacterium]
MKLLAGHGRKSAAVIVTLSLLSQQGFFVSEALAQRVTAVNPGGAPIAPVTTAGVATVPVTLAAPLGLSAAAPGRSASLPAPVAPTPTAKPAASAAAALAAPATVTPAVIAPIAVAAQAAEVLPAPAAAPAAEVQRLAAAAAGPLAAAPEAAKARPDGTQAGLRRLGGVLAKGAPAAPLAAFFDQARRSQVNAVTEPSGSVPTTEAVGETGRDSRGRLEPAGTDAEAPDRAISRGSAASEVVGAAAQPDVPEPSVGNRFIEFNVQYLKDIKKLFLESATTPNSQDYIYLLTKTFGLNLAIRVAFAYKGVSDGALPLERAIISTAWYQVQDAIFTVFGQTYMKFLGKMTGMLRIGSAKIGDLAFVYVQLVAFEFLNRLVLGPIGENPLVYSWGGIGLLLLNNLQGLISGGLLVPVINKLYAKGFISEKTSNALYQLASLTMHLGLLATFGYQSVFTWLTTALMILSWSAYIGLSFFADDKSVPEKKL